MKTIQLKSKSLKSKLFFVIFFTFFSLLISVPSFSQTNGLAPKDSSALRLRERTRNPQDSTCQNNKANDKFVDKDGDGINDNRCGRGMGLGKQNGKHNCLPQNCNARMRNGNGKMNGCGAANGNGKGKK